MYLSAYLLEKIHNIWEQFYQTVDQIDFCDCVLMPIGITNAQYRLKLCNNVLNNESKGISTIILVEIVNASIQLDT